MVDLDRIVLGENERFQPPLPLAGNPMPEYPAALLDRGLPAQTVCVLVSVDVEGKATGWHPVSEGPDCPAPEDAAPAPKPTATRPAGDKAQAGATFPQTGTAMAVVGALGAAVLAGLVVLVKR